LDWIEEVEDKGIYEVRKIPGYHDEPLTGAWKGFRSVRLSKAYRAIYSERIDIKIISVIEVSNHEY
jgi:proteic killer suppression protein